jgi:hypothetical protein
MVEVRTEEAPKRRCQKFAPRLLLDWGVCDGQVISKRVRRGRNDIKSMLLCVVRASVTLDFLFSGSIPKHYLQP